MKKITDFLSKLKFVNRFTRIPRKIFDKKLELSFQEIDMILKLLNFQVFWSTVKPNLTVISENSWVSIRTYQRVLKSLREKNLISIEQNRSKEGLFDSNNYDMSGIFNTLSADDKQLSLDSFFDRKDPLSYWEESSALSVCFIPRALDSFQKELDLDSKEVVFIKFLLSRTDADAVSEISLNWVAKYTVFKRATLSKIIKSLSDKWLILMKEQYVWKSKIRTMNRYDLKPLYRKLNDLEKKKVQEKLEKEGKWVDYTKQRKKWEIEISTVPAYTPKKKQNVEERIWFLENEISRLQWASYIWKNSSVADTIREYQKELNDLKYTPLTTGSLGSIVAQRYEHIKALKHDSRSSDDLHKALEICQKLRGNWDKTRNFYLKAVKMLPRTIDGYVATTLELSNKSKERYFTKMVSKILQKVEKERYIPV